MLIFYGVPETLLEFMVPRYKIYRIICERLEILGHIVDASECFRQMVGELADETNVHDGQSEWILGERSSRCVKVVVYMTVACVRFQTSLLREARWPWGYCNDR